MANTCSSGGICSWQNYENIIDYIKLNLGASTNAFEFSDDEILDIICAHTLPEFSKYNPLIRYYRMTYEDNLISENPTHIYQFKNFNYKIFKINLVIPKSSVSDMNMQYAWASRDIGDVTNYLMNMNYLDMQQIAVAPHTWRFFPPDKIEITRATQSLQSFLDDFIAEVACIHNDPSTINPDVYSYFRDLSLADIMIFIGRLRSKFENFVSPYGEISVNARSLLEEGTQLREKTLESLKNLPPDDFLFFLN